MNLLPILIANIFLFSFIIGVAIFNKPLPPWNGLYNDAYKKWVADGKPDNNKSNLPGALIIIGWIALAELVLLLIIGSVNF